MILIRRVVFLLSGISMMALAGCGEGYEVVQVRNQVPYTLDRTAGPGVAYVRKHMMPEKTVVIPAPLSAPVIKDAEPIFNTKQEKK